MNDGMNEWVLDSHFSKIPKHVMTTIYEYDPTYHRYQHQIVMAEMLQIAPIYLDVARQKAWHLSPCDGAEFKNEDQI